MVRRPRFELGFVNLGKIIKTLDLPCSHFHHRRVASIEAFSKLGQQLDSFEVRVLALRLHLETNGCTKRTVARR